MKPNSPPHKSLQNQPFCKVGRRRFSCDMAGDEERILINKGRRETPPLSRSEVAALIRAAENPRDKAFIAMLFLTAGRVSEVLSLRRADLDVEGDYLVVRLKTLKRRDSLPWRFIPIPLEEPLLQPIFRWLRECRGEFLFDFSRQYAWQLLRRLGHNALGRRVWPHLLRHSRLTELGSHLTIVELCQFAGWRLPDAFGEARTYLHLNWRSYAHKIPKGGREHV